MEGEIILTLGLTVMAVGGFFLRAYLLQRHLLRTHQCTIRLMEQHAKRAEFVHEQFRKLYSRVQSVREEERLRLAHEIHDGVGQLLTVVRMDISQLKNNLKSSQPEGNDSLALLTDMNNRVGTTINSN